MFHTQKKKVSLPNLVQLALSLTVISGYAVLYNYDIEITL
jgi:hypothetical protein